MVKKQDKSNSEKADDSKKPKPTKSYKLSPEALQAIKDLNDKIEDMGKSQIVSAAIVNYALIHGIKVESKKKHQTIEGLTKKIKKLERTTNALCGLALDDRKCGAKPLEKTKELVQEAVNDGTTRNANALWEELEDDLPNNIQNEDLFKVYCQLYPIPKKNE